jgi:putative copper export protein
MVQIVAQQVVCPAAQKNGCERGHVVATRHTVLPFIVMEEAAPKAHATVAHGSVVRRYAVKWFAHCSAFSSWAGALQAELGCVLSVRDTR